MNQYRNVNNNMMCTECSSILATWIGSIATALTLIFALYQISNERRKRSEQEKKSQSVHISAWISNIENSQLEICSSNNSSEPVFEVILTLVTMQGAGIDDGSLAQTDYPYRLLLGVLPPGKYFGRFQGVDHSMMKRFAVEVGFTDSKGNNWVRKGNGKLMSVNKTMPDYYVLEKPIPWKYVSKG